MIPDGDEVRRRREAAGLTQAQLAERAGVHRNTVGRVERGQGAVAAERLARLVAALGGD